MNPMATWTDQVPTEAITARGREAKPGHALLTLVLGFFFLIGWVPGRVWLGMADGVIAMRIGWLRGRGLTAEQAVQRVTKPPEPAG